MKNKEIMGNYTLSHDKLTLGLKIISKRSEVQRFPDVIGIHGCPNRER